MIISAVSTLLLAGSFVFNLGAKIKSLFLNWQAMDYNFHLMRLFHINLSWFYLNTNIIIYRHFQLCLMIILVLPVGRFLTENKDQG